MQQRVCSVEVFKTVRERRKTHYKQEAPTASLFSTDKHPPKLVRIIYKSVVNKKKPKKCQNWALLV